jgi:predicted AlkP superfamily pyrophosphatase or phosphodiesterase
VPVFSKPTTIRFVAAAAFSVAVSAWPLSHLHADGDQADQDDHDGRIRHVLLISIDGMHALDYENCATGGTCPNPAALGETDVSYTRTSPSKPSDSFPGLMALVTGGTPKTVGAYYDVAYDRVLAPPSIGRL